MGIIKLWEMVQWFLGTSRLPLGLRLLPVKGYSTFGRHHYFQLWATEGAVTEIIQLWEVVFNLVGDASGRMNASPPLSPGIPPSQLLSLPKVSLSKSSRHSLSSRKYMIIIVSLERGISYPSLSLKPWLPSSSIMSSKSFSEVDSLSSIHS